MSGVRAALQTGVATRAVGNCAATATRGGLVEPGPELLLLWACLGLGYGAHRLVWHVVSKWIRFADAAALSTASGGVAGVWLCARVGAVQGGGLGVINLSLPVGTEI